ncbi:hypothetical protein HWQ46_19970 [Shewanella sp. D64]|uniref:hypothetical protein n=1 Tax=unclassified Shewanella TaxID=196818 RepID=UPI0022BA6031|nr:MULTISPECIES: hypothetical protein [unclassified Shewanella]MEC4727817.1 hypothetical protein [Shewanella sp. D64]MEC4739354.1 hypothetical protein [Shewanella sp. E94]WBJ96989.1 hypothetical protein HWQ47_07725 [Shewanella sp. MTB7]
MFFDEIITDPVASRFDYIHSRTLTKLLFEKHPSLDALMYHSIASYGGMNIALPYKKADELLALDYTSLVKVNKAFSYGIYDVDVLKTPKNIQHDGKIIW